ncbi:hypothetical protein [Bradyrhizobium sp. HKCCYLS20291]|uniref:hypothetical protein n=1 Tax=Bradyrhizobium sp. HKCCYLS20291 TaxID=3420766 RepID=UPI003EB854BE
MALEPLYLQMDKLALYALSSTADAGIPGYWAGYRPGASSALQTTASLTSVWQDTGGVYLFLNEALANPSAFLAAFDALRTNLPSTTRILWLANPNDSPGAWQLQTLGAIATGSNSAIAWAVSRQAIYALGTYAVTIQAGAALAQLNPKLGFGIGIEAGRMDFMAPGGSYPAGESSACIPLDGPSLGALVATLALVNGAAAPLDDFARLDVGLRYAFPASDIASGAVDTLRMPILHQDGAALTVHLSFDPLNPLIPARTNLGFFAPDSSGSAAPTLGCSLVTTYGHATTLAPQTAASPLWNARLVFCASPQLMTDRLEDGYTDYYLAPDGAFALATTTAASEAAELGGVYADRLTLGLSGLEYVGLRAGSPTVALFQAGQPAFASNLRRGNNDPNDHGADGPLLDASATTSYIAFLPAASGVAGLTYFAQPLQAPLYKADANLGASFLGYHEMPAATLPAWTSGGTPPATFPVGAYSGIDGTQVDAARLLEQAALAPARRAAISSSTASPDERQDAKSTYAVTPQGMVAILSEDGNTLDGIVVGNLPNAEVSQLKFTRIGPAFQAALQSNELFFVVSNVDTFMASGSVAYRLDPVTLGLLGPAGVPDSVVDALSALVTSMTPPYPVFDTETDFTEAIEATAGDFLSIVLTVAGQLKAELDGWTFQLSPRAWRPGSVSPTVMIAKFNNRTLQQCISDVSAWGWLQAAQDSSGSALPTQKIIQDIFAAAASAAPGTPLARFYRDVVCSPYWNGILFLNAPVSVGELPDALQFLSAGIDPGQFYAHHIGFSLTPFSASAGTITLQQTAVFALVEYRDPEDLCLTSNIPFAFKTLALSARFANAALVDFAVQVELMLNRLFGVELSRRNPDRGNNLVLDGSYQRTSGAPAYSFVLQGQNIYDTSRSALKSIEVLGAQLQTATGSGNGDRVVTRFVLRGNLRFIDLDRFDLFSFGQERVFPAGQAPADGYLRFANLVVTMSFPSAAPTSQTFSVDEASLSFDPANSRARPLSLVANFPMHFTALVTSPNIAALGETPQGQTPEDLGYTSISAPLAQTPLSSPWYGLVFALDLGTMGALAGSAGLVVRLLAAWSPGLTADDCPVYLGLQLPNARSLGTDWPLEGVLRLGFRSFQFEANALQTGGRAYMLRLRRLALSVLGWSFPPGNTDVFLFGNPNGGSSAGSQAALGWYAAYDNGSDTNGTPAVPDSRAGTVARNASTRDEASDKRAGQIAKRPDAARRRRSGRRTPRQTSGL